MRISAESHGASAPSSAVGHRRDASDGRRSRWLRRASFALLFGLAPLGLAIAPPIVKLARPSSGVAAIDAESGVPRPELSDASAAHPPDAPDHDPDAPDHDPDAPDHAPDASHHAPDAPDHDPDAPDHDPDGVRCRRAPTLPLPTQPGQTVPGATTPLVTVPPTTFRPRPSTASQVSR